MLVALSAASFGCFLSFAWALRSHFRTDNSIPLAMRCLALLTTATFGGFVARLWTATPQDPETIVAIPMFVASLALFWWAVRSTRIDPPFVAHSAVHSFHLHLSGPYRWIRHPFYAAYILFWCGVATAAGPLLWAPTATLCIWYVLTARHEERQLRSGRLTVDYRLYSARTGMLLPRASLYVARGKGAGVDAVGVMSSEPRRQGGNFEGLPT